VPARRRPPPASMPHARNCETKWPPASASTARTSPSRAARFGRADVAKTSVRRRRQGPVTVEDKIEYGDLSKRFEQQTFGAHFCEVAVDAYTGEIRIRRMLAVCHAGRILNPLTARSQVIGGMTMGAGAALMEELAVDKALGFFVNHDLAGYEVPVHADIPHQEVILSWRRSTRPCRRSRPRASANLEFRGCPSHRQRRLQRHRRTSARLPDHPREAHGTTSADRVIIAASARQV
jgi:CO/xanthine dehydrogenase Mo-binding subunit